MTNIYFFDPIAALEIANTHQKADTNLQPFQEQVCFYNGEVFSNMPDNCISVPINDFYNYFLTTSYKFPEQINFDNQAFNDDTKYEITQSIIDTLVQVKNTRLQIISQIIQAPIETSTNHTYITILLDYLQFIDTTPQAIEKEILIKLLDMVHFSIEKNIKLSEEMLDKVNLFFQHIQKKYPTSITRDIKLMHLHYALFSLLTNDRQLDTYFDNLLLLLNDLSEVIGDYDLVTHVFYEEQLSDYLDRMKSALFDDSFFSIDIYTQKQIIFKYFYLTNLVYGRGEAYRGMYHVLKSYFLQAINNDLDELAFFLYTPLQMSWNGTAQTQEEFNTFNTEIEVVLEQFVKNKMLKKYQLKKNQRTISPTQKIIKVAFLQERIINYSIHKVFSSLIKVLHEHPNNQFEFTIYDLNFMEFGGSDEQTVNELKSLGIDYVDLHKEYGNTTSAFYSIIDKVLHVRERLIHDKIDILIGMHSRPEYNFLFTTRTAPKQIYWSHGNHAYNITSIDQRIIHFAPYYEKTTFFGKSYSTFSIYMHNPQHELNAQQNKALAQLKKRFEGKTVLATIGRLTKLENDEFLKVVATTLQKNPESVYLIAGGGDSNYLSTYFNKQKVSAQVFFEGHIDTAVYINIINIFLNTFPHRQGNSIHEARIKNIPCVTYLTDELKNNVSMTPKILQEHMKEVNIQNGIDYSCNAYDTKEYLSIVHQLINNQNFRQQAGLASGALEKLMMSNSKHSYESFIRCLD